MRTINYINMTKPNAIFIEKMQKIIDSFPRLERFTRDGNTYIKVIDFPSHKVVKLGESMWVKITEGDENDGYGTIENEPMCSSLCSGDRIQYGNGTDENKPQFIKHFGQTPVDTSKYVPPWFSEDDERAWDHKCPDFICQIAYDRVARELA